MEEEKKKEEEEDEEDEDEENKVGANRAAICYRELLNDFSMAGCSIW